MDLYAGQGQGTSQGGPGLFRPWVGLSTSVDTSGVNLPRVFVGGMPLVLLRSGSPAPSSSVFGPPVLGEAVPPAPWSDLAGRGGPVAARRATRRKGMVVTDRDILALQFLTRYGFATYPQLGAYLGMKPSVVRRRMPKLEALGLVTFESVGRACKVWLPTASGIDLCGLDLTVPKASSATATHSLGLVDLGIGFERRKEVVVTERELRSADLRGRPLSDRMIDALALVYPGVLVDDLEERVRGQAPLFAVPMGGGQQRFHRPDMVLARPPAPDGSPGSIALELELTRKPRSTWAAVFAGYASAAYIGLVVYYTNKQEIVTALTACAKAMDLDYLIKVVKLP